MNMTFKMTPFKQWTLTDDSIILGNKEYPITSIRKIRREPSSTGGGFFFVKFKGMLMEKTLAYDSKQEDDALKAREHIFAVMDGEDPQERLQKFEKIQQRGYCKYCNVCGHIYCYTQEDIQRNLDIIKEAKRTANIGMLDALSGNSAASSVGRQTFDNQLSKVVDYDKCPQCGSKDIRDATDEEIENNKNPKNGSQQVSSADELKKYKELLDSGVITQEEFDAKKKHLLGL